MKNYIIGVLVVIIILLTSIIYKQNQTTIPKQFPNPTENIKDKAEAHLLLYFFFSKQNCRSCLEIIDVLNNLPTQYIVLGIVPKNELKDEIELRGITGAEFPILGPEKYYKFIPWYTPSIIGVIPKTGKIVFIFPSVAGGKEFLLNFLESLYGKIYDTLL